MIARSAAALGRPEPTEDRGAPLEGVRDFYGKRHHGEPIRGTEQEGARNDKISHYERRLLTVCRSAGADKNVNASRASWAEADHGVDAAKGWW